MEALLFVAMVSGFTNLTNLLELTELQCNTMEFEAEVKELK